MKHAEPTQSSLFVLFSGAIMVLAGVWAILLCWLARYEMLDDALIHLRYATVLHDRHIISFDGINPNYGASSLLYVALLALLRSVTHSPLLPKLLSVSAYAILLGISVRMARKSPPAVALLLVLVSPFAVRWLTDGMETSLACALSVVFCCALHRKASPALLGSIALILSLLRVDLTLLAAFGAILLSYRRQWVSAASVCAGSCISLAFIQLKLGHLLPDTALAKEGLRFMDVLSLGGHEILATYSFGLGLVAIWIATARLAWSVERAVTLICNLPFPALILLAALKGQQIHGIRYVVWALLFSIVWNVLATADLKQKNSALVVAFACVLFFSWVIEFPKILRVDRGRSHNLWSMQQANLDRLHGLGVAADVGYLGYFSGARVCDLSGLVNGRKAAMLSDAQRARLCASSTPSFLFVSATQRGSLDYKNNLNTRDGWIDCGNVDFTNVNSDDRHWLLLRRTDYPAGCPGRL